MFKYIQKFLKNSVTPISQNEDSARREFILNVLLLSIVILSFSAFVISLIGHLLDGLDASMPTSIIFIVLSFFIFLYFLSRKGLLRLSSYGLLTAFFLPVTYSAYKYGINLPTALLSYVVIIVMTGVLINTRVAFIITFLTSFTIIIIGYLQKIGTLSVDRYWITEMWDTDEFVIVSILFLIIATVAWLSNREIEKSLARARRSEADLKKERDSLEITVEARTRELKETQAEKMIQLYRFAEFGRLSSGLFHDLINPLTAVSLNLEQVKNSTETKQYADRAVRAAKKMEDMVNAVRKQISRQETKTLFSVNKEIAQALEVLSHKAQKSGVAMRLFSREDLKTYGDAVKFNQAALNLVCNAIDACQEKGDNDTRTVTVSLSQKSDIIIFEVKDKGVGISEENKPNIFEPFFTTKKEGCGLGIGLSIVKRIIEKDFNGNVSFTSKEGKGSVFTVKFPQKNNG